MSKGEQVNLQRTLAFVSFFYFIYSAGKACLFPFLTLYLRQLGLSATQTGIIFSLKAFVALWAAPLWSSCTTQYSRQRLILMGAIFMTIASNLGLTLLPPADEDLYFAFCKSANNSLSDDQELSNKSVENDGDTSGTTAFMQNSLTQAVVYTSPLENRPVISSTPVSSMHTPLTHPLSEPYQDITTAITTPNSQSPRPNSNKHGRTHEPRPKHTTVQPVANSRNTQEDAGMTNEDWAKKIDQNNDKFQENVYGDSIAKSEWLDGVQASHINQLKPSRDKSSGPHEEEYGLSTNEKRGQTGISLNWETIIGQKLHKESSYRPNTRHRISSSTYNSVKHTSPVGFNRKDYDDIAKRSVSNRPDEIAQKDQLPRSLGSARESLHKTIKSFLEFENIIFIIALFVVVIGESLACPVDKICDSSLHETLDSIDELDKYNRHHVPSIVGYGLFALIITLIVDNTNCRIFLQASRFMIHFYIFAGLLGLTFLLALFYPIPAPKKGNRKPRFCKGLKLLLSDPHNTVVTLTMVITGALASNIHNFLFWRVQDLGGSEVTMGVAVLVAVGSHIPMLFITGWLNRKLSQQGTLVLAVLCLTIRLLYFTFLWTPWAVVPIEVLCAFSQQALWATVTSYGEQISPPAMDRSIKSILNSLYHGLGFAIGSALGGVIFDQAGFQVLYGTSAAIAFLWGVAVALVMWFVPKKRRLHYSSLLRRDEDREEEFLSDEDSDEVYGDDWLVNAMKDDF